MKRVLIFLCLAGATGVAAGNARAEDYVAIRGFYYREASTRVIQPIVEVERDSPSGVDVGAHFLLDAITSASIAAGTAIDSVFTETRSEAGLRIRKRWERTDLSVAYKYSAESDYWAHTAGVSGSRRFWGDTATIRLSVGRGFDTMTSRAAPPACRPGMTPLPETCSLDTWFAGLVYTQVLSPVALAQVAYEAAYLDGFQGNVYRMVPGKGVEFVPEQRLRNAISPRVAYYIPSSGTGFQLNYRYYWDFYPGESESGVEPWALVGHTVEARMYQEITANLELRLLFRQHIQNQARFWCDTVANPDCYAAMATYYSSDPKLGPMFTEYPEIKLVWEAEALRGVPFFGWFAAGSFEVAYGHYFQNTTFGNAHVLQTGYRMPF